MAHFLNVTTDTLQNAYGAWLMANSYFLNTEQIWQAIRQERDNLLSACDWTQGADLPLSEGQKRTWAIYRQALRDLPNAFDDPASIVWPVEPEG